MNTHNKQEELERILVECSKGKSNIEDIEKFINSEVNTVLERLKEKQISFYVIDGGGYEAERDATVAVPLSAITALQQEYKEKL